MSRSESPVVEDLDSVVDDAVTTELNAMEREMELEIEKELSKFNEETYPSGSSLLGGAPAAAAATTAAGSGESGSETLAAPDPSAGDKEADPKIDAKTVAGWL